MYDTPDRVGSRVQLTHRKCIIFNGHQSVFMIYRIRKNSTKMKGLSFRQKDPSVENIWGKIRLGGYFISIWYGILFLSALILIIYRIIQIGHTFRGCFCPEVYGEVVDLGVIITDFVFTP